MMDGWSVGIDGWLFMGAWILALLFVVWLLVHEPHRTGRDEALDTLRSRLSRGEISPDEFDQAQRLIVSDAGERSSR